MTVTRLRICQHKKCKTPVERGRLYCDEHSLCAYSKCRVDIDPGHLFCPEHWKLVPHEQKWFIAAAVTEDDQHRLKGLVNDASGAVWRVLNTPEEPQPYDEDEQPYHSTD